MRFDAQVANESASNENLFTQFHRVKPRHEQRAICAAIRAAGGAAGFQLESQISPWQPSLFFECENKGQGGGEKKEDGPRGKIRADKL